MVLHLRDYFCRKKTDMKNQMYLKAAVSLFTAGILAAACFKTLSSENESSIRVCFESLSSLSTRTGENIDIGSFFLNVTESGGDEIYNGYFKDSPEVFGVSPGSYTVSAVSRAFSEPEYDAPVYGDTKVVVVSAGEAVDVKLNCEMQNCGMGLTADTGFKAAFPDCVINMKSDDGNLPYIYGEGRIGYFQPGRITVTMDNDGKNETLFTKVLDKRQILCIGLSAPVGNGGSATGITIQIDTTKEWLSEDFLYGEDAGTMQEAMDIHDARNSPGATGVWIAGYIVGCATSTSKVEFDGPFTKNTNIVLGERASTTDREYCMAAELKSGTVRDALNLSEHPENEGRKVLVKGDIVSSYYGMPGIKNITEYSF